MKTDLHERYQYQRQRRGRQSGVAEENEEAEESFQEKEDKKRTCSFGDNIVSEAVLCQDPLFLFFVQTFLLFLFP